MRLWRLSAPCPRPPGPPQQRLGAWAGLESSFMSRTEQEERLEQIFSSLEAAFKKVDKTKDDAKRQAMLKDITAQLRDAKT